MLYVRENADNPEVLALRPLSQGTPEEIADVLTSKLNEYLDMRQSQRLTGRFKENETYMDGNHWDLVPTENQNEPRPTTPILWSTAENIHADLVEAYPKAITEAQNLPDSEKAKKADILLNSLAFRRRFKIAWTEMTRGVLQNGLAFIETFWNKELYNGLGDADYRSRSARNVLFDTTVSDLNDSEALFIIGFQRRSSVKARYPLYMTRKGASANYNVTPSDLAADLKDSTAQDLVLVADAYWRELKMVDIVVGENENETVIGQRPEYSLHWVKLAGGAVVDQPVDMAASVYAHGEYPLDPYTFLGRDGSLFSLGLVDRFKKMQWYMDKMDQQVLINLILSAKTKLLVGTGAGLNKDDLLNWENEVVEGTDISERSVRWFDTKPFANAPMDFVAMKAASMKEESGCNQFYRGEGGRGVTAASAISMLQEAAGKRSRKLIDWLYTQDYGRNKKALSLMAEFYTEARTFQYTDADGVAQKEDIVGNDLKADGFDRLFDMHIKINSERDSGYKTMVINQQAIELAQAGALDPYEVLNMMRFDGKEEVMALKREREQSQLVQLQAENEQLKAMLAEVQAGAAGPGDAGNFVPPETPEDDEEQTGDQPAA